MLELGEQAGWLAGIFVDLWNCIGYDTPVFFKVLAFLYESWGLEDMLR